MPKQDFCECQLHVQLKYLVKISQCLFSLCRGGSSFLSTDHLDDHITRRTDQHQQEWEDAELFYMIQTKVLEAVGVQVYAGSDIGNGALLRLKRRKDS